MKKPPLNRPPGRPQYQPTAGQRRRVREGIAAGRQHSVIANQLGLTVRTLRRHFVAELEPLKRNREAEMLDLCQAMYRKAMKGSAAAQKWFLRRKPEYRP